MKPFKYSLLIYMMTVIAHAEIGIISHEEANQLTSRQDSTKKPLVLDTRAGYKDYFAGTFLMPITSTLTLFVALTKACQSSIYQTT
jgi:hypothetical protein